MRQRFESFLPPPASRIPPKQSTHPGGPIIFRRKIEGRQYLGWSSTNAGVTTFTFSAEILPWWVRRSRDRRRAPREPFHPCRSKASSGFRHRFCGHPDKSATPRCGGLYRIRASPCRRTEMIWRLWRGRDRSPSCRLVGQAVCRPEWPTSCCHRDKLLPCLCRK